MALLDKNKRGKVLLDDTTPLKCTIDNIAKKDHVVSDCTCSYSRVVSSQITRADCWTDVLQDYIMKVQRGANPEDSWQVSFSVCESLPRTVVYLQYIYVQYNWCYAYRFRTSLPAAHTLLIYYSILSVVCIICLGLIANILLPHSYVQNNICRVNTRQTW